MKITVNRSAVIEAPIDRVWAVLRDFNSHRAWHPNVVHSKMENDLDGDVVGGVRRFRLGDGAEIREQLLVHSDTEHTLTYCILDSTLPFFDYVAKIRLRPVTDADHTFLDWRCRFLTSKDRAVELEDLVGNDIYEDGIAGLRTHLFTESPALPQPTKRTAEIAASNVVAGDSLPAHAVVRASADSPETVSLIELRVPPPKPGQVRIRLKAIGVNRKADMGQQALDLAENDHWEPSIEGVGEIIDVGPQVNGLFPGDRVACIDASFGAYVEIRCVDANACILLPDSLSDIHASVLLKGISAQLLLNRVFHADSGSMIMLQPASGGLGHIVSQWAKSMRMTVIGAAGTAEEARFIRRHGCDFPIIDSGDGNLRNEVMRITNGRGVDYWIYQDETHPIETALSCLARFGHLAVLGTHGIKPITVDVANLNRRSLTVSAPDFLSYLGQPTYLHRLAHKVFSEIEKRNIIPAVETFPLNQASNVLKKLKTRDTMGALSLITGV